MLGGKRTTMWKQILKECVEVDKIALTLHILLIFILVTLKGGGVIIVSWLWVFMPLLYSAAHCVLYIFYGFIRGILVWFFLDED
jgi:hypothetical protein